MSPLVYHDGMPAGDEPTLLGYAIFNWDGVVAAALLATAPADHYLTRCIVQLVADSGSPSGSGFIVNLDSGPCPSPDALTPAEADTFRLQSDRLGLPMDDTQRWAYVGARWDLPPDEEEPIESPIGVLVTLGTCCGWSPWLLRMIHLL